MQTVTDEMGNERIVVTPGAKTASAPAKKTRINDVIIAEQVLDTWGEPLAYQAGQFWSYSYDEGWTVCTNEIQNLANELRGANTEGSVMKILAAMRAIPDLEHSEHHAHYWEWAGDKWIPFIVQPNQVLFSNGVLTIGSELEFEPTAQRVIYGPRISWPYTDELFDAFCPEFESLIEYAIPDADQRAYLQRLAGLVLQPHVLLRGQIVFWGVPHSGKSTLANAIASAPAGVRGMSSVSEGRLVCDKWASTLLVNRFVSVSHDSEFTPKWEAFVKQYTTGTFIAEAKFAKPAVIAVTAKLISTCNEMQGLRDLSGAVRQRYKVFRFTQPLEVSGRLDQTEKMTAGYWAQPERRAGILGWLLSGLIDAHTSGLNEPESITEITAAALEEANPVKEFLRYELIADPDGFVSTAEILAALNNRITAKQLAGLMKQIHQLEPIRSKDRTSRGYTVRFN